MSVAAPGHFPAAFAAAWAARDADALAALFARDADFVNVVGIWWEDRAAIRNAHAYGLTTFFAQSRLTVGRVKLRRLGNIAIVNARLILTGQTAPDGTPAGPRTTIATAVLEETPQGWLCVAFQNTDIVPGAESRVATDQGLAPADYRQNRKRR